MDIAKKELVDELISYRTERKPVKYLVNAYKVIGDQDIIQLIGWLLLWQKQVFLELEKPEKFNIDEVLYERYLQFFKECPPLGDIFSLHTTYIGWASNLSQEQQNEIRNYIHANYKAQIRIRKRNT